MFWFCSIEKAMLHNRKLRYSFNENAHSDVNKSHSSLLFVLNLNKQEYSY